MTAKASPRFLQAVRSGKPVHYFAELWPRTIGAGVDGFSISVERSA